MDFDLEQKCPDHPNRNDCPDALVTRTRSGFGLIVASMMVALLQSKSVIARGAVRNFGFDECKRQ
jgi:hypothetical protein